MYRFHKFTIAAIAMVTLSLVTVSSVVAQEQPARRRQGQQPGQGRPGAGLAGRLGQRGLQVGEVSLLTAPVMVVEKALNLNEEQKKGIAGLREKMQTEQREALQAGGGAGGNRQEMMQKRREMTEKYNKEAIALLNDDQKKKAPELLKELTILRDAGIPLPLYSEINLTKDQKTQLEKISKELQAERREKMQEALQSGDNQKIAEMLRNMQTGRSEKVNAILTKEQKDMIEKFEKDNPQRRRPGAGGAGGGFPRPEGGNRPPR